MQVAHFFRADSATNVRHICRHLAEASPEDPAWGQLDALPADVAEAILKGGHHPDCTLAAAPERWRPTLLQCGLLHAECGLETTLSDTGGGLTGLRVSAATLDAHGAALAAAPGLRWLQVLPEGWAERTRGVWAADRHWRALERTLAHPWGASGHDDPPSHGGRAPRADGKPLPEPWSAWPQVARLTQLRALDVSESLLTDAHGRALPGAVRSLPALEHLCAAGCGGHAAVLAAAAALPALRSLNVSAPAAGAREAAAAVAALTQLHSLDISGCTADVGALCAALRPLAHLKTLRLDRLSAAGAPVDTPPPAAVAAAPPPLQLTRLSARGVGIRRCQPLLTLIGSQASLRRLDLSGTEVAADPALPLMQELLAVEDLVLSFAPLLRGLTNLEALDLSIRMQPEDAAFSYLEPQVRVSDGGAHSALRRSRVFPSCATGALLHLAPQVRAQLCATPQELEGVALSTSSQGAAFCCDMHAGAAPRPAIAHTPRPLLLSHSWPSRLRCRVSVVTHHTDVHACRRCCETCPR